MRREGQCITFWSVFHSSVQSIHLLKLMLEQSEIFFGLAVYLNANPYGWSLKFTAEGTSIINLFTCVV